MDRVNSFKSSVSIYASVVGAAILLVPVSSNGEIIYVNDPDIVIDNDNYDLDLDGDGSIDFQFVNIFSSNPGTPGSPGIPGVPGPYGYTSTGTPSSPGFPSSPGTYMGDAIINRVGTNSLVAASTGGSDIAVLESGNAINAGKIFRDVNRLNTFYGGGLWGNKVEKFAGVKFKIEGDYHYGWIRMSVTSDCITTIHDWAYEDIADTEIEAGSTAVAINQPPVVDIDPFITKPDIIRVGASVSAYKGDWSDPDNPPVK